MHRFRGYTLKIPGDSKGGSLTAKDLFVSKQNQPAGAAHLRIHDSPQRHFRADAGRVSGRYAYFEWVDFRYSRH
jgi:hypothetical protein